MSSFNLIKNIDLNNFNALIYSISDYVENIVTEEIINSSLENLNNQETAIEIAEILFNFDGVSKIEIFNKSNTLILEVLKVDQNL